MSMTQPMDNRGGYRPTAPQNSPMNISATGGNGQSGRQAATYIPGLPYGEGQQTYAQQTAAPMAAVTDMPLEAITGITAPTQRSAEPITAGVDFGPGPGSEVINLPNTQPTVLSVLRQIAQNDPTGETDLIFQAMIEKGVI
jgi:hypothetical protein